MEVMTLVVVAYNGASYAGSSLRGHSIAFTMTAKAAPNTPDNVGDFMPSGFALALPEPSTCALVVLMCAGLTWFYRKRGSA